MKRNIIPLILCAVAMLFASCKEQPVPEFIDDKPEKNIAMENLLTRRSVRQYTAEVPPMEVIEEICKAGTYAPTGMNRQSPIIIAVTNKELRDSLSRMNARVMGNDSIDPFYGAPVVLVVLADKNVHTCVEDGSLVMGNLMNAAHAKGLGSCWIHRAREVFETEEGKQILKDLGIEGEYEGVGNCILGYAAEPAKPAAPRREGRVYRVK